MRPRPYGQVGLSWGPHPGCRVDAGSAGAVRHREREVPQKQVLPWISRWKPRPLREANAPGLPVSHRERATRIPAAGN